MDRKAVRSTLIGAAFLMATSAIGPGFLTQTAVFTERLGASFAFAILISVIVDLVAQLNIWRVLAVSARRAQDVRSEEHTSELQSQSNLVCRLLLEKKKKKKKERINVEEMRC